LTDRETCRGHSRSREKIPAWPPITPLAHAPPLLPRLVL